MSEPLLFVVCADPEGLAVVCTGGVLLLQVGIGWGLDHQVEIAGSWADGLKWLAAQDARARRVPHALGLWLLTHLVRAHGRHRAGAA
jgi:hypothetical protein